MIRKIMTDKGEKEIDIKPIKGRHTKKVWKILTRVWKEEVDAVPELIDELDKIGAEISGMTVDELNDLDVEEKEKITTPIAEKAMDAVNFMKPSLNVANSTAKTTAE